LWTVRTSLIPFFSLSSVLHFGTGGGAGIVRKVKKKEATGTRQGHKGNKPIHRDFTGTRVTFVVSFARFSVSHACESTTPVSLLLQRQTMTERCTPHMTHLHWSACLKRILTHPAKN
jgi:hypothetical protein